MSVVRRGTVVFVVPRFLAQAKLFASCDFRGSYYYCTCTTNRNIILYFKYKVDGCNFSLAGLRKGKFTLPLNSDSFCFHSTPISTVILVALRRHPAHTRSDGDYFLLKGEIQQVLSCIYFPHVFYFKLFTLYRRRLVALRLESYNSTTVELYYVTLGVPASVEIPKLDGL